MSSNSIDPAPSEVTQRHATMITFALVGIATTGYFLGLTSPMAAKSEHPSPAATALLADEHDPAASTVIPATAYAEMATVEKHPSQKRSTSLSTLRQEAYDPLAKIEQNEAEKIISLAHRESRRAFNGAPPTVPHPIDQLDSTACMACHGKGLRSKTLRASKMPHPYYANCTQCHVEQRAQFAIASATFENSFIGLAAPTHGARSYSGAPPVIPHSTMMRNDCLSCHGRTSQPGMATTHLWRSECLQCHGESSQLNQTKLDTIPKFLPSPERLDSHE